MQGAMRLVPEVIAKEAYKEYADQGHGSQSFERLHQRGGFTPEEIITLLYERIRRMSAVGKSDG